MPVATKTGLKDNAARIPTNRHNIQTGNCAPATLITGLQATMKKTEQAAMTKWPNRKPATFRSRWSIALLAKVHQRIGSAHKARQTSQGYPKHRAGEDTREYNPTDCHRTQGSSSPSTKWTDLMTVPVGLASVAVHSTLTQHPQRGPGLTTRPESSPCSGPECTEPPSDRAPQ